VAQLENDQKIRAYLASIGGGQLRLTNREQEIPYRLYNSLYIPTGATNIALPEIVILGEITIWGRGITGHIHAYHSRAGAQIGSNQLTITRHSPRELFELLFPPAE